MSGVGSIDHLIAQVQNAEIVKLYKCDSCKDIIHKPNNGYLVVGNIYTANPDDLGGLIGNNFPETEKFAITDVSKSVFCKKCFLKAINADKEEPVYRNQTDDNKTRELRKRNNYRGGYTSAPRAYVPSSPRTSDYHDQNR